VRVKDRFLEKINLLIFTLSLCLSHSLYAENIYKKVLNYNNELKNSVANFIQTNDNYIQEGEIFFGGSRIKIVYLKPKKITVILSEKKGVYINHQLKESNFFATKNSYIKFFFDMFYNKKYLESLTLINSQDKIELIEKKELDNVLYNIKLVYENEPIKLRRLEIIDGSVKTQMGFFNHRFEQNLDKKFFSMTDPYLN